MRFGRAPHNIMHFGKRGGSEQMVDSYLDQEPQSQQQGPLDSLEASAGSNMPSADWIVANLLAGSKGANSQHATRYILVPVRDTSAPAAQSSSYFYPMGKAAANPVKKAKFSEDSDNVFTHFG